MHTVDPTRLCHRTTLSSALSAAVLLGVLIVFDGATSSRAPKAPAAPVKPVEASADAEPTPPVAAEPTAEPSLVVQARTAKPRSPEAEERLADAKELGAHGAAIDDPCLSPVEEVCERTALEPFFRSLDALEQGSASRHASVAVIGNSLIAADHIIDVFRERLVERFGNGGRGFVLADRMAEYGGRTRTGHAKPGRWTPHNFSMGERGAFPFGVAGVLHVSKAKNASTSWTLDGEERARVFLYEHEKSPVLELKVDDAALTTVEPEGKAAVRTLDLAMPEGARALTLEAKGPGAVVYGALLERRTPGVIVNSFGVPAADATHFLSAEPDIFRDHLLAQDPSLVIVMLGGNETKRLDWGKRRREDVERDYTALLDRLSELVPGAACLAVGPIDAVRGGSEKSWRTRAHLPWVIEMQKRVAAEKGCAYFDLFEAMGGAGSLKRFANRGLLHDDMVHPRQRGLDLLGELLADALLDAYEATPIVNRLHARR